MFLRLTNFPRPPSGSGRAGLCLSGLSCNLGSGWCTVWQHADVFGPSANHYCQRDGQEEAKDSQIPERRPPTLRDGDDRDCLNVDRGANRPVYPNQSESEVSPSLEEIDG